MFSLDSIDTRLAGQATRRETRAGFQRARQTESETGVNEDGKHWPLCIPFSPPFHLCDFSIILGAWGLLCSASFFSIHLSSKTKCPRGRNPPSRIKSTQEACRCRVGPASFQFPDAKDFLHLSLSCPARPGKPTGQKEKQSAASGCVKVMVHIGPFRSGFSGDGRKTGDKPTCGRGSPFGLWWAENDDADTT